MGHSVQRIELILVALFVFVVIAGAVLVSGMRPTTQALTTNTPQPVAVAPTAIAIATAHPATAAPAATAIVATVAPATVAPATVAPPPPAATAITAAPPANARATPASLPLIPIVIAVGMIGLSGAVLVWRAPLRAALQGLQTKRHTHDVPRRERQASSDVPLDTPTPNDALVPRAADTTAPILIAPDATNPRTTLAPALTIAGADGQFASISARAVPDEAPLTRSMGGGVVSPPMPIAVADDTRRNMPWTVIPDLTTDFPIVAEIAVTMPDDDLGGIDDNGMDGTILRDDEDSEPQDIPDVPFDDGAIPLDSTDEQLAIVAHLLARAWKDVALESRILAMSAYANGRIGVTIDCVYGESAAIMHAWDGVVPDRHWKSRWNDQRDGTTQLILTPPRTWTIRGTLAYDPLLLPLIQHGKRADRRTTYLPLEAWRNLGVYGPQARTITQSLIVHLLAHYRPDDLALVVLGDARLTTWLSGVPHLLPITSDIPQLVQHITRLTRRPQTPSRERTTIVIVSALDAAAIRALVTFFTEQQRLPQRVPFHIIVMDETPHRAAQEVYVRIPGMISLPCPTSDLITGASEAARSTERGYLSARQLGVAGDIVVTDETEQAIFLRQITAAPRRTYPPAWGIATLPSAPASPAACLATDAPHGAAPLSDAMLHGIAPVDPSPTPTQPVADGSTVITPTSPERDAAHVPTAIMPERNPNAATDAPANGIASATTMLAPHDAANAMQHGIAPAEHPPERRPADVTDEPDDPVFTALFARVSAITPVEPPRYSPPDPQAAAPSRRAAGAAAMRASVADAPPPSAWPTGPCGMRGGALEQLVIAILDSPETLTAALAENAGISKRRVMAIGNKHAILTTAVAQLQVETLLVWMDDAGVLAAPLRPKVRPFFQTRKLAISTPDRIRDQLWATPLPNELAVRTAFREGGS